MNSPRTLTVLVLLACAALLGACGPKRTELSGLASAQAPNWRAGDYWEFTSRTRSPFAMAQRMEVVSVGQEIVLRGDGDAGKVVRLNPDLSVRESKGGVLSYSVASGVDAYLVFPLEVGAAKTFTQSANVPKGTQNYTNVVTVEAAEEITVPAGTFKTFRIRVDKRNDTGWSGSYTMWYAPEVGYFVRVVDTHRNDAKLVKFGKR